MSENFLGLGKKFNPKTLESLYLENEGQIKDAVLQICRQYPEIKNPKDFADEIIQDCYLKIRKQKLFIINENKLKNYFHRCAKEMCEGKIKEQDKYIQLSNSINPEKVTSFRDLTYIKNIIETDQNLTEQEREIMITIMGNPDITLEKLMGRFNLSTARARSIKFKARAYIGSLLKGEKPLFFKSPTLSRANEN